jgi:peptidyl-prolyl cis-trans isomerase C
MHKHRIATLLLALGAVSLTGTTLAQDAPKKAAPPKAPAKAADSAPAPAPAAAAPAANKDGGAKEIYSQALYDFLLKERLASGQQPDSPQLREMIRDELINRELVMREAKRKGLDKDPAIKASMELNSQTVLVRAYMQDFVKANPPTDDQLKKDYEMIKSALGSKEYRARHILVEKEDEAKEIITQLQKGDKFEKLATERSKDPGSKEKGGDLDWASPANFAKPFSDAMVGLQKGKFTPTPVQTQFGWHVIMLEDVRDTKPPSFEEVKPNLTQRAQGLLVEKHLAELRTKAAIK